MPEQIPIVFHNGSDYDYHFIIKELVEEIEGQFTCLGENADKYITFLVPKVSRIERNGKEIKKLYPKDYNLLTAQNFWQGHYQILLITSLWEFKKLHLKEEHNKKKCETSGIKYKHYN